MENTPDLVFPISTCRKTVGFTTEASCNVKCLLETNFLF